MRNPTLTSIHNPKIKQLLSLDKVRERKRQGLCSIEGFKEVSLAKDAGYEIESIFYCPDLVGENVLLESGFNESRLQPVSQNIFNKIAYRENTGGVIAVAVQQTKSLAELILKKKTSPTDSRGSRKTGELRCSTSNSRCSRS